MGCSFTDISCDVGHYVDDVTGGLSQATLSGLNDAVHDAMAWVLIRIVPLWISIKSPDLSSEPSIDAMHAWLLPVTATVAVCAMIAAGARMAITRRAAPLLDIATGLITIAVVSSLGVVLPDLLMSAGDTWSQWILNVSTHGQFLFRVGVIFNPTGLPSILSIFLGIAALIVSIIQAVLLVFRQAAVVLIAALLPLAAAGSIAPLTRGWIRKLAGWMLALICYKPAAAAVYAAAFTLIGNGSNIQAWLMGWAMILLSFVAMPTLMRFFTWTTGTVSGSSGGGQFLATAAGAAAAIGAVRGGHRTTAAQHAADVADDNPPPPPPDGGPSTPGGLLPPPGGGPGSGSAHPPAPGAGPHPADQPAHTGNQTPGNGDNHQISITPDGGGPAGQPPGTRAPGTPASGSPARTSDNPANPGPAGGSTAASRGKTAGTAAASAGAGVAAMLAAQALANGAQAAKDTANTPLEEGDRP